MENNYVITNEKKENLKKRLPKEGDVIKVNGHDFKVTYVHEGKLRFSAEVIIPSNKEY